MGRNTLADTHAWFYRAVPKPDDRNMHVQFGVHLEEVRELLLEAHTNDLVTMQLLCKAKEALYELSDYMKKYHGTVTFPNRVATLDAICDQLVTNTGLAHMLGMDPVGGLSEVNTSNWSKFDANGDPIFDDNKKIKKGPNYRKPDLKPFT